MSENEQSDWFHRDKGGQIPAANEKGSRVPEGLWQKCKTCDETVHVPDYERNLCVCPRCQHHGPISVEARVASLIDEGTWQETDAGLRPTDPLDFIDSLPYHERLDTARDKAGRPDAFVNGRGKLHGHPVRLGLFDFGFMGGSMGSVVGEKVTRLFEAGLEERVPVILLSSSGGARMQEGVLSLMQMAKANAALANLRDAHLPFISVMTHPTTGGVAASFATLGDVNLAEPKALIGFAGPRVIEQTIRQRLPPGFQRSEYLLEHGMVDRIVHRHDLKDELGRLLSLFWE